MKGKTALITGASRGIGPHIALSWSGRPNANSAGSTSSSTTRAAILCASLTEMSIEENLTILDLDLTAPIALTHLVLPSMLSRGSGHIINISAMAGRVSFPFTEAYAAANGGLIGFTRVLRSDYRARGVTASVLILGAIAGAGQGQRTLDDMKQKTSAFMAPVEMVTKALLRALDRDKAELVVMPGPGRLMRALMDFFPGMGPWMNQQVGVNKTLREVQDFRRSQNLGV